MSGAFFYCAGVKAGLMLALLTISRGPAAARRDLGPRECRAPEGK